jgi:hypothetical protein
MAASPGVGDGAREHWFQRAWSIEGEGVPLPEADLSASLMVRWEATEKAQSLRNDKLVTQRIAWRS